MLRIARLSKADFANGNVETARAKLISDLEGIPSTFDFRKVFMSAREWPAWVPETQETIRNWKEKFEPMGTRAVKKLFYQWERDVRQHIIKNCLTATQRSLLGKLKKGIRGNACHRKLVFWRRLNRWAEGKCISAGAKVTITPMDVPAQAAAA
jgi:hypothetical protein